jgi:hypothetical protein
MLYLLMYVIPNSCDDEYKWCLVCDPLPLESNPNPMHTCEEWLSIELATQYYNESDHDVLGHHEVQLYGSDNGYFCSD